MASITNNSDTGDTNGCWRSIRRLVIRGSWIAYGLRASLLIVSMTLFGQAPQTTQQQGYENSASKGSSAQTVTVHGLVRNGLSGEPLPRALVRIDGDAATGTLTDGEGHFEIPGVAVGSQEFEAIKPGFVDQLFSTAGADTQVEQFLVSMATGGHSVLVAAEMPDVVFTMVPVNSIQGKIQLSTGDPAQGIGITLLSRTVQDGRVAWQTAYTTRTNAEGAYRFGGLAAGIYVVHTDPAMDSDSAASFVESGSAGDVARNGYASLFYPDSRDLAGATKIRLAGGEQAQANFSLMLEPFQSVAAHLVFPGGRGNADESAEQSGMSFSPLVLDGQGHPQPYSAQYDPATHTIQAYLPDGNFSLFVTVTGSMHVTLEGNNIAHVSKPAPQPMTGMIDFAVAGHAIANLKIPIAQSRTSPVQVTIDRTNTQSPQARDGGASVTLSQTGGWISDGMVSSYAQGSTTGPLETTYTPPGSYWVHTNIAPRSLCEESFTAGGASLAREPLVLGLAGPSAPLSLTLRNDCTRLTLSLPASFAVAPPGQEVFYIVYVVPDFDSTQDVVPQTLRPSTGGRVTLTGLTPGSYHIYAFDKPVALEYHNAAALAALQNPGQAVTLSAGAQSDLVLEVQQH